MNNVGEQTLDLDRILTSLYITAHRFLSPHPRRRSGRRRGEEPEESTPVTRSAFLSPWGTVARGKVEKKRETTQLQPAATSRSAGEWRRVSPLEPAHTGCKFCWANVSSLVGPTSGAIIDTGSGAWANPVDLTVYEGVIGLRAKS